MNKERGSGAREGVDPRMMHEVSKSGTGLRRRGRWLVMSGAALALCVVAVGLAGCADGDKSVETTAAATTAAQPVVGTETSAGIVPNTITVTGDATVNAAPDEATITLSVETDGSDPTTALDNNSKSIQKVLDRLKAEGVAESAIQTSNVSLYPIRTYDPQTGKESLTGYRAQNAVTVTLKEAAVVGKILAASVETGATNVSGPVWRLTEDSAAVTEALKKAVANAQAKAQTLAEAGGVKVGQVVMMTEGAVEVPIVPVYMGLGKGEAAAADSLAQAPISAGTLDVTATVTITYALER